MNNIVLFGAGTTGRVIARDLNAQGKPATCFVDNDVKKQGTMMEGIPVFSALEARKQFPDATWVASVVRPERHEIIAQIAAMDVNTVHMWDYVPKRYNLPPESALIAVRLLMGDKESVNFWNDQLAFRAHPESYQQIPQANIDHIYFEDFIVKRDDEHFVDCGAADGDTIKEFEKWQSEWAKITAFEPDEKNFEYLRMATLLAPNVQLCLGAVGDQDAVVPFTATGDYSAHISPTPTLAGTLTSVWKLDSWNFTTPPTFIKMDIEGSELEALWGARSIIKDHKPVMAICAYHEAEHLWDIPLLIHAIQPEYELFLRRYAESTFELVWYAVPKERVR